MLPFPKIRTNVNEKGEALPAAIIGALVSSIVLLGVGIAMSFLIVSQHNEEKDTAVATDASSVATAFKSDLDSAATVAPVSVSKTVLHISEGAGECRLVTWEIMNNAIYRTLSIYSAASIVNGEVLCNTGSGTIVSEKKRTVAENLGSPSEGFRYYNKVGREILPTNPVTFADSATVVPSELSMVESEWASKKTSFVDLNFRIMLNGELVSRDISGHKSS